MQQQQRPGERPNEDLTQLLAEALRARQYIKDHPEPAPALPEALAGEEADILETTAEHDFMDMEPAEIRRLINQALSDDDDDE